MSESRTGRLEAKSAADEGFHPPTKCRRCGVHLHQHDRRRVHPDDGPDGTWHYEYDCPDSPGVCQR